MTLLFSQQSRDACERMGGRTIFLLSLLFQSHSQENEASPHFFARCYGKFGCERASEIEKVRRGEKLYVLPPDTRMAGTGF